MKCHYDVLEISRTAAEDEIRKSYRKLALKWHPDKNLNNAVEAKDQFQLIQQAYEVLSDPQERSWYDKHRDTILTGRGSDYKDDSLNVYEYFTTSCFSGFGDDLKGFYSIYAEVFKKIAAEDSEFDKNLDSDFEIPVFGCSSSNYEEVVHPFYAYWQSYSTKKTYSWLDEYDIRQAPNRRVVRLMEKENKKKREKARRERNEEIRALVSFVRKRDKRVIEHIKRLELEGIEKDKKSQEVRRQQILKRQAELNSYVESDWSKFSNLEDELKGMEANLASEFKEDNGSDDSSDDEKMFTDFFCVACNKIFKTPKAFSNHENSKKHKDNVEALRLELLEDEADESDGEDDGGSDAADILTDVLNVSDGHLTNENNDPLDSVCTEGVSFKSSGASIQEDSEIDIARPRKKKFQKQKKRSMKPPESDVSDDSIKKNLYPCDENPATKKEKSHLEVKNDLESEITENEISDPILDVKAGKVKKKYKPKKSLETPEMVTGLLEPEGGGRQRNRKVVDDDDNDNFATKSKKKKNKKVLKNIEKSEELEEKVKQNTSEMKEVLSELKCEVCQSPFKSKNELFRHLKETEHAIPKETATSKSKTKKSKK